MRTANDMRHGTKKTITLIAVCAIAAVSSFGQQQVGTVPPAVKLDLPVISQTSNPAEEYSPAGGGFSVVMPGKPAAEDEQVETGLGRLVSHTYSSEGDGVFYAVMYSDFPVSVTDPTTIKDMFDGAVKHGIAAVRGELKSDQEINLDGHPGREWLIQLSDGRLRARAYWANQRFYQVLAQIPDAKDPAVMKTRESAAQSFFDSFRLTSRNLAKSGQTHRPLE